MTSDELKAIEQRAEKATPGPWKASIAPMADHYFYVWKNSDKPFDEWRAMLWDDESFSDCEFIAAARTDVPALIAEVRRLQALLPKLEGLTFELRGETVVVEYHRPEYGPITLVKDE